MRAIIGALGAICLSASGCAELDPLSVDVCGNQVLEPGEDCDRSVSGALGPNLACGAPGTAGACRYVCSSGSSCPVGWGCGRDAVCRAPSIALDTPVSSFAADRPQDIACGDFDGDGRWDVAARFPTQVEWLWGDGNGRFETAALSTALLSSGRLLAADLDDDQRADLVGPSAHGLEVWRGASERPPLPVA